jgi:hypothetical protein
MREFVAGQEGGVRFWAALSSAVLAVLCIIAGGALLFTEKVVAGYDIELPQLSIFVLRLGLGSVAATWLLYMIALIGLLGYRRTDTRELLAMLVFAAAFVYLCIVIIASILPFMHGIRTIM